MVSPEDDYSFVGPRRLQECEACERLHEVRLGITNAYGFFCSFLHAFNYHRNGPLEGRWYTVYGNGPHDAYHYNKRKAIRKMNQGTIEEDIG